MATFTGYGENARKIKALNCSVMLAVVTVIGTVLYFGYKIVQPFTSQAAMFSNEEEEESVRMLMSVTARSGLNVRTEPSTEGDIVLVLKNGEKIEVLSNPSDQWVYIRCIERNNEEGYASSKYLTPAEGNDTGAGLDVDIFTDSLKSEEDINSYSFEMSEYGDAVIFVTGLQEKWDGYTYHWLCAVYKDGSEAVIAYANVRGYSVNDGPTIISVPKLDAGTYHIQMRAASSNNPLMASFTKDPYSIRILKYYHSTPLVTYDSDGIQTFQNANDVLWAYDGTGFIKLNDGECMAALMKSDKGAIVPVLIGRDEASVEYVISSTGQVVKAKGPWHYKNSDIDYYYSECRYIDKYTENWVDTSSLPMLYINTNSVMDAAEKIFDKLETLEKAKEDAKYKEEHGEIKYLLMKHGGKLKVGGVIAGVLLLWLYSARNSTKSSSGSRTYSGGSTYSGGNTYSSDSTYYSSGVELSDAERKRRDDEDFMDYIMKNMGSDWGKDL